MQTTRRQFLAGLLGTAIAASIPAAALEAATDNAWQAAIVKIYQTYMNDFVTYGTAAIGPSDTFPFIRNISPQEFLAIPEIYRSTGEY